MARAAALLAILFALGCGVRGLPHPPRPDALAPPPDAGCASCQESK
jgi:hypothetical protein